MVVDSGAKQCFVDLAKADTSGDYEKALRIANKVLRTYPKETMAFKCKLVALIQLGRMDEALTLIKKTPPHHMGQVVCFLQPKLPVFSILTCIFEKAYVLYRLNEDAAALETLNKAPPDDYRCAELRAQLLYRAEKFEEASKIFMMLLKEYSDDYDEVRRTNLIATIAQLQAGGFAQISVLLEVCSDTLIEEGLAEEEIEEELSVIRVQKAFVLQKLGRNEDAFKIYLRIQDLNVSDKSVTATVANNIPSARSEQNLLEARKKLKAALQVENSKLTCRQRRTLLLNQALVHLFSNQREPCRRTLEEFAKKFGRCKEMTLVEAALHVRSKDSQKALAILESDTSNETKLTALQILLDEGKLEEASQVLNALPPKLLSFPAILQLKVAILLATNQQKMALDVLKDALGAASDKKLRAELLEEVASLNIQLEDYRSAVDYLQQLFELRPDDLQVVCRLIKAYATFDPQKAEELSMRVFPHEDSSDIDVDALEFSDAVLYGDRYRQKKETKVETLPDTVSYQLLPYLL
ncbi:unnamed protein product [Gongylonema pulchrum]|uniref:TPR_REGION domain-containing protein n=1 Tax=Gongylonema pulchrum TaxID=637853 RepID=A0A183DYF5_9BILA|nr:unnamed protein product [Gongylonema pulchrum]